MLGFKKTSKLIRIYSNNFIFDKKRDKFIIIKQMLAEILYMKKMKESENDCLAAKKTLVKKGAALWLFY